MAKAHTNGKVPELTPAQEFRLLREVGRVTTLSTGRVVKWRPVRVKRLLREGKVPDLLTAYVMRLIWDGRSPDERSEEQKAKDWFGFQEMIVSAALMHPVVSANPTGDEIHIDDLEPEEVEEIYDLVNDPLREVTPFRGVESGTVAAAPEGDALPQAAK